MDDDSKLEAEKEDLLSKIEILKVQIKNFENELGISTEDLQVNRSENDYKIIDRMKESEKQLSVIETLVKSEVPEQNQFKSMLKNQQETHLDLVEMPPELTMRIPKMGAQDKKIENTAFQNDVTQGQNPSVQQKTPDPVDTLSRDLQSRTLELKQKSEQIAQISSLVSRLRSDMLSQPKSSQQSFSETPHQALENTVQQQKVQQVSRPQQTFQYSAVDLPALATMVQKLNELVKANEAISEELREIIDDNKNVNNATRISDLVRKLAVAGLNG